jgi:hypothetical protein
LEADVGDMDRKEVHDLYSDLRSQYQARNGEYDRSRQRYRGEHWDAATNPAPANRYSLTANYLKPIVDKSVQSLVGRQPAVQVMAAAVDEVARRHAEQLEAILYGTWYANNARDQFVKTAFDSFLLRRGLIYVWWDPKAKLVKFKSCTPDHFYPEYDGEDLWRMTSGPTRRRTTARRRATIWRATRPRTRRRSSTCSTPMATTAG